MKTLEFRAMNTTMQMAVEGQERADEGLGQTRSFIQDCEQRFSRFLPGSELSRLNSAAGQWMRVSQDLLDLLVLSVAYYKESAGLFDPSVLPDLKRAGYDVSMDEVRARGDARTMVSLREPQSKYDSIEVDAEARWVRIPEGMQIDLGGIAKGWIVEKAAETLRTYGTAAAVNAGGDMFFAGIPAEDGKWNVEIEDPRDAARTAATLQVGEGAVVTSSVSKRAWTQAGDRRHHIIDPRTGEPAETEWLSVTVIAPHADLAEAYAKAFLIGGRQEATRLMLQRPHIAVVCIDGYGQVFGSPGSKDYINDNNSLLQ